MNFLGVGSMELIVVLGLALLVLGPKQMIEASRGLGKIMRDLRRQRDEFADLVMTQFDEDEDAPADAPAPEGAVSRPHRIQPPSAATGAAAGEAPAGASESGDLLSAPSGPLPEGVAEGDTGTVGEDPGRPAS